MHRLVAAVVVFGVGLVPWATSAHAEPSFLSKQYTRCTSCHISPTGGGLLSSYGRSLSARELSMTSSGPADPDKPGKEEQFLWGALGDALGPVQLGVELRPSHLRTSFAGFTDSRNILMTADVIGAVQHGGVTVYGQVGRDPVNDEVKSYVEVMNPELADRVEFYDAEAEGLPLYERFHIHEQLHKALDRKVWLPSGGSLIIEHTEALTVIDVNTGRNVGTTNLEATVLHNNLEAADEIARQLRLRDIGGIIVIDFIDMEIKENRRKVVEAFREALSRDKTRSQVFDISELGLVEMTRKRIGEGLLQSFASQCPHCEGRGVAINTTLLD